MGERIRLRFSKTGKAKYISHLDLMSVMRRALMRAGIDLKYSEGYNPHPYMSAALPLPVGCGSICELLDFEAASALVPGSLPEIINAKMPEGIRVLDAYTSVRKFSGIAWLDIEGAMYYDNGIPQDAAKRLTGRFMAESIVISKKTKSGVSDIDIAPLVRDAVVTGGGDVTFRAKVSAQNPTITPDNLMSALDGVYSALKPDFALFTRIETYDANMDIFR